LVFGNLMQTSFSITLNRINNLEHVFDLYIQTKLFFIFKQKPKQKERVFIKKERERESVGISAMKCGILYQNDRNIYLLSRRMNNHYSNFDLCLRKLNANTDRWDQMNGYLKPNEPQIIRKKSVRLLIPMIFKATKQSQATTIIESSNKLLLYMYHSYRCCSCFKVAFVGHKHHCLTCLSITPDNMQYEIERLELDLEDLLKENDVSPTQSFGRLNCKAYQIIGLRNLNNQCHLMVRISVDDEHDFNANKFVVHVYHDFNANKFKLINKINSDLSDYLFMCNTNKMYHHIEQSVTMKIHQYSSRTNNTVNSDRLSCTTTTIAINSDRLPLYPFDGGIMIKGNYCVLFQDHHLYLLNLKTLQMKMVNRNQITFSMDRYGFVERICAIVLKRDNGVDEMLMGGFIRGIIRKSCILEARYPPNYLIKLMTMYFCEEKLYFIRMNRNKMPNFYSWKVNVDLLFI